MKFADQNGNLGLAGFVRDIDKHNQAAIVCGASQMKKMPSSMEKAAGLRNKAEKALRLAEGLNPEDCARLTLYSDDLRLQATELEGQAAAETPSRPSDSDANNRPDGTSSKKGRGGSNDPEPQN